MRIGIAVEVLPAILNAHVATDLIYSPHGTENTVEAWETLLYQFCHTIFSSAFLLVSSDFEFAH